MPTTLSNTVDVLKIRSLTLYTLTEDAVVTVPVVLAKIPFDTTLSVSFVHVVTRYSLLYPDVTIPLNTTVSPCLIFPLKFSNVLTSIKDPTAVDVDLTFLISYRGEVIVIDLAEVLTDSTTVSFLK